MATPTPAEGLPRGALTGLRVVEAATVLAAPMIGMLLADHGADVIKVESPTAGDPMRSWGYARGTTPLFWKMLSRNKRLVTLDLHHDEAQTILLDLLRDSDVFIENFRPGTLERWGLTAERLFEANPALVILRVSGFGQVGPYSARPGFGTLAEAFSGFAAINGWPDRPPTLPPFGLADAIAAYAGAFGVLAAVRAAGETGVGQDVDVSLYEPMLTALGSLVIDYDQLGVVPERVGNRAPFTAPRNAYETGDGKWIAMSCATQSTFQRLMRAIGHPGLASDPRFGDNPARTRNARELDDLIGAWMRRNSQAEALSQLERAAVPAVAVQSVADLVQDQHVRERGSVTRVEDPELGPVRMPAPVPRLTRTPGRIRHLGGAPGVHNDEVYGALNLSAEELADLRSRRII